jgi:hypothetical protein
MDAPRVSEAPMWRIEMPRNIQQHWATLGKTRVYGCKPNVARVRRRAALGGEGHRSAILRLSGRLSAALLERWTPGQARARPK